MKRTKVAMNKPQKIRSIASEAAERIRDGRKNTWHDLLLGEDRESLQYPSRKSAPDESDEQRVDP